ncbi:peptidoglycan-binding domain-containing protein, partial [Agrobacterium pusense]
MQNAFRYFSLTAALTLCSPAFAAPIDAQAVNTAAIASLPIEAPAEKQTEPNPAIVHLQVLLDRAGSSPGVIDGYFGDNLTKAIAGFEAL